MTAKCEYVGDTKFAASNVALELDLQDWLGRATREFAMAQLAAKFLNMDDIELESLVHDLGDTDEERGDAVVDLAEWFKSWREWYTAGEDITSSAFARFVIIAERMRHAHTPTRQHRLRACA